MLRTGTSLMPSCAPSSLKRRFMTKFDTEYWMTIDGRSESAAQTLPVFNPATRSEFARVPDATRPQLDQAVVGDGAAAPTQLGPIQNGAERDPPILAPPGLRRPQGVGYRLRRFAARLDGIHKLAHHHAQQEGGVRAWPGGSRRLSF